MAIVSPGQVEALMKTDRMHFSGALHLNYDYDDEEGSVWAVAGSQITIVVRVICFPPAPKLLSQLQPYYQVHLAVSDEYGQ